MEIKPSRLLAQARLASYIIKKYKIDAYCIEFWKGELKIQGYDQIDTINLLEGWKFEQKGSYKTATFEGSIIRIVLTD